MTPAAACFIGPDAVATLNADWQAACDRTEGATIFQTMHWLRSWCDAVALREGAVPVVLRVPASGPLRVGIALQRCETAGKNQLRPLSSPWADYHDAVGDGDELHLDIAGLALERLARELDAQVVFDDIRPGGLLAAVCARLDGITSPSTPVCRVDLLDRAHLRRVERAEHRVKRRRLARRGVLELVRNHTRDQILAAFPQFVTLHRRQWMGRDDAVAPFTEPGIEEAFAAFAEALSPYRLIDLTELRLNGKSVAAYYGFIYRNVYYAYRTAFDPEYFSFSPGHLMLQTLLWDCAEDGLVAFDLMRGDYAYKVDYATLHGRNLAWRSAGAMQ